MRNLNKEVAIFYPLVSKTGDAEWFYKNTLELCKRELGPIDPDYLELQGEFLRFQSSHARWWRRWKIARHDGGISEDQDTTSV